MNTTELLTDAFGRVRELVTMATDGLGAAELAYRPDPDANSIAWLTWHLTRVQDDHVSELAEKEQAWTSENWFDRFAMPFQPAATGYGHSSDDVALVAPEGPEMLRGYHEMVSDRTLEYLAGIGPSDLGRIIDESWNPPVTVGVRLVSVISDNLQHAGQARYVRGMIERTLR